MKRIFYYLECDNIPELFSYLDEHVDDGYITYEIEKSDGVIIINNLSLDDDDILFSTLSDMDLIEEYDLSGYEIDEDYDDFYNGDDI